MKEKKDNMMTDRAVVQFVCFTTPLPRIVFTPAWVPCVPNHNAPALSIAIKDAFAALSDISIYVYQDSATNERQRFDIVAEIYGAQNRGAELATRLEDVIDGSIDVARSSIGIYREVLTLPPLHK